MRFVRGRRLNILILAGCLLYGWLWHPDWNLAGGVKSPAAIAVVIATLIVITGAAYLLVSSSLNTITRSNLRQEKALWLGSAGLALLLCAMMPFHTLTDLDNLYRLAVTLALPDSIIRLVNLFENLAIIGLTFGLAFCAVFSLWTWLRRAGCPPDPDQKENRRGARISFLIYALPCLVVWSFFLYGFWPGIVGDDTYVQWLQITNLRTLNDWHPVAHTLLEYLLTRLWYNPAIIAIFQIIIMALIWGWAMSYFETRGFSRKMLFLVSCGFALFPPNGVMAVTLMKDELYTVFTFALVFLLGVTWASRGAWLDSRRNQALLGLFLGLPFLFRHNGEVALLLAPLALFLLYRPRWKAVLTAALTAVLLVVGIRNGLAFGLLKAGQNPEAVMYLLPIQHISAVGYYGGVYTPAQKDVLKQIAPIQVWREQYNPFNADYIGKSWGVMGDPYVYDKIERNRLGLLRIFGELFLKYPATMIRSEMDLMNPIWAIVVVEKEPAWYYKFSFQSYPPYPGVDPKLFFQPNLSSPVKSALNKYLAWSDGPVTAPLLWRGGIYMFLTLALAVIYGFTRGRHSLLLFVPSLANLFSLFLSMPMQNFRYLYPYIACIPLLFLFGLLKGPLDHHLDFAEKSERVEVK